MERSSWPSLHRHVMEPTSDSPPADQTKAPGNRTRLAAFIAMGLTLGILVGWLVYVLINSSLLKGAPDFYGVVMPEADQAPSLTLTSQSGESASLSDFEDKVVLLYFGYTYCPDVCPATLVELSRAMKLLDELEREQVQVLMVSVDPARDTPEVLAEYMAHFDPSFIGLTGSESEIAAAADAYGIFVNKQEGTIESGYLVDHTANVAAIDQDGNMKLIFKFDTPAEEIAADLQQLLDS